MTFAWFRSAPGGGIRGDGGEDAEMEKFVLIPGSVSGCLYDEHGGTDVRAGLV